MTQEKLAYECDYSKSYISEVEAGKKLPSLTALAKLAERLEVEPFDLLVFPEDGARERLVDATRTTPTNVIEELVAKRSK